MVPSHYVFSIASLSGPQRTPVALCISSNQSDAGGIVLLLGRPSLKPAAAAFLANGF